MLGEIYKNTFRLPPLPPAGTFNGQTILITGATSGLGLAAAVHFLNLGASHLIITSRTHASGITAKKSILSQTTIRPSPSPSSITIMELDLSTLGGIPPFVAKLTSEVKKIDYVLLNAGMLNKDFVMGKEGWEETLQVNVLSTALLGVMLVEWLKVAGGGRGHLGIVGSGLHKGVKITPPFPQSNILSYFNQPTNWPKDGMYATSKLFIEYVALEISKLALGHDGSPQFIVTPLCPGMVRTSLARSYQTNLLMTLMVEAFMKTVSKTTEAGARTPVLAALQPPSENGTLYTNYASKEENMKATEHNIWSKGGQEMQKKVWGEIIDVLAKQVPEVTDIAGLN